ncbi:DUF2844 domain-containing protein [Paraburkholderia rhynchosiae]|uniref:DUF2844 domain-containing protein n=1 Tax=Paraburkholderia rhynchosiae TaxID=487049 RepID=A0A2N7VT48_9BURK|nr:DUF2844 domain-containing protein [Paraburkholderia rhynchosiae]PMS20328.1 hypothetical protein C0Z16_34775 [Paraburkholderia rhynchosiae]CAB3741806.1 hypothetical protein LMG27174_06795 [Paraburkholderia rhynchosiae]
MKIFTPGSAAALLAATFAISAHAALGGAAASVQIDQKRMKASRAVQPLVSYSVHRIVLDTGTAINEYVSPAGTVFAVSWLGPQMPDVQTLLGSYAPAASDGTVAFRAAHGGTGPVTVGSSALVVQSGGHMGAYIGRAYIPRALPAGVSAIDIK